MGDYVDIDGHPTWVEASGRQSDNAETVLLLHGGLSNSDELLGPLGNALGERWRLVAFDRRGHGRTKDTDRPFHYDDMATETIGVLETVVGGPAHLVGWSDGGIVALLVALRRPELVRRMVLIGANFHFDGLRPLDVGPDSPVFALIRDAYVERSPDGAEHFETVAEQVARDVRDRTDVDGRRSRSNHHAGARPRRRRRCDRTEPHLRPVRIHAVGATGGDSRCITSGALGEAGRRMPSHRRFPCG